MNVVHKLNETPKERLLRVERSSRPFHRELGGPTYLIGVALLFLAILVVVVGIVGGMTSSELMQDYARRIFEWALPGGR
jgi:hypothetical protein